MVNTMKSLYRKTFQVAATPSQPKVPLGNFCSCNFLKFLVIVFSLMDIQTDVQTERQTDTAAAVTTTTTSHDGVMLLHISSHTVDSLCFQAATSRN